MIQLVLVRHAAADPAGPGLPDHERPLSSRGVREAADVAKRVLRAGVRSEVVLSSTAVRARTTAEALASVFGAEVAPDAELYGAGPAGLLAAARASGASEVTVVGHDPAMSELVSQLAGRDVSLAPGTAAVFTWNDGGWDTVDPGTVDDFSLVTPG